MASFTDITTVTMFLHKTTLSIQEAALVNVLIPMVDGMIKNYCGWEVLAKDYTDKKFSGNGSTTLDLYTYPVNSVTKLEIDGADVLSSVSINTDDGELYFTSSAGYTFTSGTLNIVTSFNAGYASVPSDMSYAANWLVTLNAKRILDESVGVNSEKFNDIAVDYDKADIPQMVKNILDRYRRIGIY